VKDGRRVLAEECPSLGVHPTDWLNRLASSTAASRHHTEWRCA
jgi:hypothetical protein